MNSISATTDLSGYLPEWYKDIAEYKRIMATESSEAVEVVSALQKVKSNFYVAHLDLSAIVQWESVFDIIGDSSTETIAFRRDRILNRLSSTPPFTMKTLQNKLDEFIGEGNYNIVLDGPHYTVYVETSSSSQGYMIELTRAINSMKPAHIAYINTPLISAGLDLNEAVYRQITLYNYRLGAWSLGTDSFMSDGPEEVITLATTSSITAELISDTTAYIGSDIASALINDTVSITDLTKTYDAGKLTVTYYVLESQANPVTSIKLADSDGNILTESNVYVPVTTRTMFKHIINTKEGV